MKKILFAIVLVAIMAAPLFAQNAFSDVPTDHWSYSALNKLGLDGYIEGYPDGTFKGNRVFTRYEMAMIVARVINYLEGIYGEDPGVLTSDLDAYIKASDLKNPDVSGVATKEDLEAVIKLANEFKAELTALGLDVNALNADVNALKTRVSAIEEEQARVKITGELNVGGMVGFKNNDNVIGLDGYPIPKGGQGVTLLKDFQVDIKGKVSNNINAYLTLVAGDYLKRMDDERCNVKWQTDVSSAAKMSVVPYYVYAESNLEKYGDVKLGRLPMQINKYVFKRYDNDTYFDIARMDNGDYQTDGIDYKVAFGPSVDARAWIVQPQYDSWADPTMYGDVQLATNWGYPYRFNTPDKMMTGLNLGFNISTARLDLLYNYNEALVTCGDAKANNIYKNGVYGATLGIPFGSVGFDVAWYQSKTKDIESLDKNYKDKQNLFDIGLKLDSKGWKASLGYKQVDLGFSTPGDWEQMAWLHNPYNIKGWNAMLGYGYGNFDIYGNYKDYKSKDDLYKDFYNSDKKKYWNLGAGYNTGKCGKFDAKYESLNYFDNIYNYLTISWLKSFGKANVKLGYQYINNQTAEQKGNLIFGQAGYSF